MTEHRRYWKCDRCGVMNEIIPDDSLRSAEKKGPWSVSFTYRSQQAYRGTVSSYHGEWCSDCTTRDLEPLTRPLPQVLTGAKISLRTNQP